MIHHSKETSFSDFAKIGDNNLSDAHDYYNTYVKQQSTSTALFLLFTAIVMTDR